MSFCKNLCSCMYYINYSKCLSVFKQLQRSLWDDKKQYISQFIIIFSVFSVIKKYSNRLGGIMYFDWITWSIWLIGLIILIIWIYVPIKEFKKLYAQHKKSKSE